MKNAKTASTRELSYRFAIYEQAVVEKKNAP